MTATVSVPDYDRFTKNDNQLVAFEAIVIVGLCTYIMLLHWWWRDERKEYSAERKETNDTNKALANALTTLTEVVRHVSK